MKGFDLDGIMSWFNYGAICEPISDFASKTCLWKRMMWITCPSLPAKGCP